MYEKMLGYDFSSTISQEKLGYSKSELNLCSPSDEKTLKEIFKYIKVKEGDSILDIGCAKGLAVSYFLSLPFSKVGGLEISEILLKICKKNIEKKHSKRASLIHADASKFEDYAKYNYFYMYNPFPTRKILEKVVDQIINQVKGEIFVIYNNPVNFDIFIEKGFMLKKKLTDPASSNKEVYIFSKK